MKRMNVLIIHGIGDQGPGYARELEKGVKEVFQKHLIQKTQKRENYSKYLDFKEILWADILRKRQEKLEKKLKKTKRVKMGKIGVKEIVLYLVERGVWGMAATFIAHTICDIIAYLNESVKYEIQEKILKRIGAYKCNKRKEEERENISIVSHSLGTVICSDFVYDQEESLRKKYKLHNIFTMGSPIVLFSLKYDVDKFKKPIKVEDTKGRWINILDKDDPIAYELRPINKEYRMAVHRDQEVNTGPLVVSHMKYWSDKQVHQIIGTKLAIDWLRLNKAVEEKEVNVLYEKYDKNIGIEKEDCCGSTT